MTETTTEELIFEKQKQRSIAYKEVFASDLGKRVLYDLMLNSHMLSSSFSSDPLLMAMKEGERNVCLRILKLVDVDIKQLEKLIREADKYGRYAE